MTNKELFTALELLEKEKGIPVDYLIEQISKAIVIACKNTYGGNDNVKITMDREKNAFDVKLVKQIVEEVENPNFEITLEDAKKIKKRAAVGKELDIPLDPKQFGRIAVQTSRNVIRQGIRDGEKGQMLQEFESKTEDLVTAIVERIDHVAGNATIRVGKAEVMLPRSEMAGTENVKEGDHIKVYVVGIKESERGPRATVSRTHPNFVKKLFEGEVPEVFEGIVEIKNVSREAGERSKVAVWSKDDQVDAVGSCIGVRRARVNAVVEELGGEKIDIVKYDEDPAKYIAAALSPANVVGVEILDEENHQCKATVPDSQLSLAIGNKGQNVRLAARLTGWKIDIRPESGFYGEES
ncbi:MAG: transcription termination factor NusA [Oscillospiraceae bacterium]|jgi:N utilization substance protein A|nr:transcription termination factor NusA [Oscillospiraceae bacterium]